MSLRRAHGGSYAQQRPWVRQWSGKGRLGTGRSSKSSLLRMLIVSFRLTFRSQRGSLRNYNLALGAVATCRSTHVRQPGEELVMHPNTQRRPQVCPNALAWPDTSRRIVAAHDVNIDQFNVATTSLVSRWKGDLHVPIHKIAAETSAATSG